MCMKEQRVHYGIQQDLVRESQLVCPVLDLYGPRRQRTKNALGTHTKKISEYL